MPTQLTFGPYVFDLEMPDLPAVLMRAGRIPDPVTAAVVVLLAEEGSIPPSSDDQGYFARNIEALRGMYAVMELCVVGVNGDPARRFRAFDPRPGDLGPRDVGFNAPVGIYWTFFRGGYRGPGAFLPDDPGDADGAAEPAPAGDAVPPPAE